MQQITEYRDNYKPVARKLRSDGRTQAGLWRKALSEGKDWSSSLFNNVCNGWSENAEIEAWLEKEGLGEEVREARRLSEQALKAREAEQKKLAEEAANV